MPVDPRSITRRGLFALCGLPLAAQQQILYRDYSRCLPDFYRHLVGEAVRKRNEAIGALTSESAIRRRQSWVRETFWNLTGGMPDRTPLRIRTTGEFQRSAYRVEKLIYESQPGFHVPANLYIPKVGSPPYPAVLFQMGHSGNGKAAGMYQKCCQGLAQLGFAVLAFDPMGQGERVYYPRSGGNATRLRSSDDEHTTPGQQLLLVGQSATRIQTWDAIRSLDVLAAHPLIDAKRLATTGNSGGGTLSMFLAATDDRLAAVVASCPNSENFACEEFIPPGSVDDAEQNFVGSGPLGFDRWDTFYPLAPKPLLIVLSGKDFFGTYSPSYVRNGRQEYARLSSVYRTLGKQDNISWWESPLSHGLQHEARMRIYAWFRRWLQGRTDQLTQEPPVSPENDETLYATEKGNTVYSLSSLHPADLGRKVALRPRPIDLQKLLGVEELYERPRRVKLGESPAEGCRVEAMEVSTATHVWTPCWIFHPKQAQNSDVLLVLDARGRNADAPEGGLWNQLAKEGITVCAADVRANGDLSAEAGRGSPRYTLGHASEHNHAWAGAILGQSLLGQRVADIVSIVRALKPSRIRLAASGKMTVPALFAAAMEPSIASVYLSGGLASYQHLLNCDEYPNHPFANFLPRVLLHTDLPAIAAGIKATLTLAGLVDGAGKRVPLEEAKRLYARATVLPDAAWNLARLKEFR
ncbi:MAG: acetylxylan esterase [Candidatus Solibacter usitatus]|nr:acetylxylan esterase [Candidatus Solibacter usitatus]